MSGEDHLNPEQFFAHRHKKDDDKDDADELLAAKGRHPANGDDLSAQKRKDRKTT